MDNLTVICVDCHIKTRNARKKHWVPDNGGEFKCDLCGLKYENRNALKKHKVHDHGRELKCKVIMGNLNVICVDWSKKLSML